LAIRSCWQKIGDPVLHIELRRWADLLLLAPASADTIAKAANGISDNLVLCIIRAWDFTRPCLLCPAMNTLMLRHPSIISHYQSLKSFGSKIIEPESKLLACGDIGKGALASIPLIITETRLHLNMTVESPERTAEKAEAATIIASIHSNHLQRRWVDYFLPRSSWMTFNSGFVVGLIVMYKYIGVNIESTRDNSIHLAPVK
jgi:phosphopantothenoylcysteine synthetase/decarboxylase